MSSHDTMNSYGGVHMGRTVDAFNPNERLLERILSKENVAMAWKRVKANHGAPNKPLPKLSLRSSIRDSRIQVSDSGLDGLPIMWFTR
jgi:hypothetical protein